MVYIKYMPYRSAKSASRNRRELAAAAEYGFETVIFSNDKTDPGGAQRHVWDGSVPMTPKMSKAEKIPKILRNYLRVWYRTAKLPDGVWSCHDLGSLRTAWLVTRLRVKKPQLIYDSHEFEMGRNTTRTPRQWRSVARWERFLMRRCAFSVMVNDSIADEVQRIHKLPERPVVVRSTPARWTIDPAVCAAVREGMLRQLAQPDVKALMMFHGNMGNGVGLECLVETLARVPDLGLVLLGSHPQPSYFAHVMQQAETLGVRERILVLDAVPLNELWKYVGAVDLEMMVGKPPVKSYYYALPNKMFEAIQAETPIITSDRPEMSRIVREYGIGLICTPGDTDDVCRCIEKLRTDRALYARCRDNLKRAKDDLCWEKEKQVFFRAYEQFLKSEQRAPV